MPKLATMLFSFVTTLAIAACSQTDKDETHAMSSSANEAVDHADPVKSAMTAAPAAVASDATIIVMEPDGKMKTLRAGKNGFTCMADNPATPGPDPMCMDANALKWAEAWIGHKTPPAETPGVMYMLAGGTDASNIDPYATAPTGRDEWIKTGPHMMLVGSRKALEGYPSGPSPDTSAPYVMWAGTAYAHLMLPIK